MKKHTEKPPTGITPEPALASTPETREPEGRRKLRALSYTAAELGARIGVSKQTVAKWRLGTKTPGPTHRQALAELFEIPTASWALVDPRAAAKAAKLPRPSEVDDGTTPLTLVACNALLERLRALAASYVQPVDQIRACEAEARLLAIRARLEREAADGKTVLAHPTFRRAVVAIQTALKPFPKAWEAVEEALDALVAE